MKLKVTNNWQGTACGCTILRVYINFQDEKPDYTLLFTDDKENLTQEIPQEI